MCYFNSLKHSKIFLYVKVVTLDDVITYYILYFVTLSKISIINTLIHPCCSEESLRSPGGWWQPERRRSHVSQRTALIFSFAPTPELVSGRQLRDEDGVFCQTVYTLLLFQIFITIHFRLIFIAPIPSLLMSRGCRSEYHAVAQGEESGGEQSKVKVNRCEDTSKEYRRWKADTLAKQVHPGQLGISQETACSKVITIKHGK